MARLTAMIFFTLVGGAALVASAFQPWYRGRDPRSVPVTDLITGLHDGGTAALATSMLLPLALAAALALLGLGLRSRAVLAVSALLGLATGGLFLVQQIQAVPSDAFHFTDLRQGLFNAVGGAVFLVIAMAVLPSRESRGAVGRGADRSGGWDR
ncbi:hypothetical protein [Streptomyces celluloflavus]|uniref:hypothetical protein n=1 Tax=Streptomyces celluloflavus TaxID=58344 RepID=UPI0036988D28